MADGETCKCGSQCCVHTIVKLRRALSIRLMMPIDGHHGLDTCQCTPSTRAVISTVWEGNNKGRRVLKCPAPNGQGCSFQVWLDGPITGRALVVIDFLYHALEQLVLEKMADESAIKLWEEEYETLRNQVFGPEDEAGPSAQGEQDGGPV